jgi:serine/threonine protein kinase
MPDLLDHFQLLPKAAQTMGGVHLGVATSSRATTDAKTLALKVATDDEKIAQMLKEVQTLMNLQHEGIVAAHGIYAVKVQGKRSMGMVLDYKSGGDLSSYIPAGGLPEWMVKGIMAPICDALRYLHAIPAVHRDIKPSNVLCERAENGSVKVVLADFGLAAYIADRKRLSQRCGTGGFIAPEIFQADWTMTSRTETATNLTKIDVFSFGMMIYATVFGHNPFLGEALSSTYRMNARALLSFASMADHSVELQALLSRLCAKDYRHRFSSAEALAHPWLGSDLVDWAALEAAAHGFPTDL